jgi:uncharacterized protein
MKTRHEVRDGIYGFVQFDNVERRLIDSPFYQRLRHIHQLAMSYQVYPGATHKRFEHCLGVMEMAGRIFDVVTDPRNLTDDVRQRVGDELEGDRPYWRRIVRLAGLMHDLGHLPFSHGAEEWLPDGWNHERITAEIIRDPMISGLLTDGASPINPEHVIDLCWDVKKRLKVEPGKQLSPWVTLLNEIITGNTFGADRIDYLLRDSWHVGVTYGRFDPERLISGLRIVVDPRTDEIALGLDEGAIHAAEALLLARYFMYTQVYFHDVRRIYDVHLKDFVKAWLDGKHFPITPQEHLRMTDNDLLVEMNVAALDQGQRLHPEASRLLSRDHFRTVYSLSGTHKRLNPDVFSLVVEAVEGAVGKENVRNDSYTAKSEANSFPVRLDSGEVVSSDSESGVISNIPPIDIGFVFVHRSQVSKAEEAVRQVILGLQSVKRKKRGSKHNS